MDPSHGRGRCPCRPSRAGPCRLGHHGLFRWRFRRHSGADPYSRRALPRYPGDRGGQARAWRLTSLACSCLGHGSISVQCQFRRTAMPIPAPALEALSALLGARLSTSGADRDLHAQSETFHRAPPPDAVAWPLSTGEVSRIAAICRAHHVPMIGWGTGTSLEGQALAPQGGLVIDLSKMDRVLEIRAEDMQVSVQPGCTREALNTELRTTGLFFPVDPGAHASLGGMAATRASGTTAVRYGTMRDNVLALEVVLADGRVIRTGTRAAKSSAGYDLTALFIGSEGTLGIITELTLRLHGQPEEVAAAVCGFPTLEQ